MTNNNEQLGFDFWADAEIISVYTSQADYLMPIASLSSPDIKTARQRGNRHEIISLARVCQDSPSKLR